MPLTISDLNGDWEVQIPLPNSTVEAFRLQLDRLEQKDVILGPVLIRLAERISTNLLETLDVDLRPPSKAQVKFALAIAKELGISLPGEALQYRATMHDFLSRHAPLFYSRTGR